MRLVRPGTNETVFETTVTFPPGQDTVALQVTVPVQGNTEQFALTMDFVNAQNDTVFKTGPDTIAVLPGAISRPLEPAARYTGVGANAASIRIDSSARG
ncbi:MAG: hypothetical protein HYR48_04940, partial [Gemmatimonadetes bacterium]|nr:hypothetical protein [Gemmatimonadota bacterium]